MIKVFRANDTNYVTNGEVILKPISAVISKNIEEEYIEVEAPLKYAEFLIQDNVLLVDTLTGKKGYKIHNPIIGDTIEVKAWLCYQEAPSSPADRGVVISHGKNLKNCKVTENWDDVVTILTPIGYNDISLPEGHLSVPSPYQREYAKTIEFDLSEHLEEHVDALEEQIELNASLKASLENSLTVLSARKNTINGAINGLQAEINRLQQRLSELGNTDPELREKAAIQAQIPILNEGIASYTSDIQATETAIQTTNTELAKATADLNTATQQYNELVISDLRSQAQSYLDVNKYPKINYDLEAHLNGVLEVGDTVKVKHPDMRVDLLTSVTAYDFDCLTMKFRKVVFGTLQVTLKGKFSEVDRKIEKISEKAAELNRSITKYASEFKRDDKELVSKFMSEVYGISNGVYGLLEKNQSLLRQTASSITAQVSQVDKDLTTRFATLDIKADGISATVSANYNSLSSSIASVNIKANQIQSQVTEVKGDLTTAQSTITQQANQINLRVEKNKVISEINQTSESIKISANRLDLQGYATFSALAAAGQTVINGGNITTGTLDCSKINVTNLNAGSITTGNLSASRISGGVLNCNNITVTNLSADSITSGSLNAFRISGGTLNCNNITVTNLSADSINSGKLGVDYIGLNGNWVMGTGSSSNALRIGGTYYTWANIVEIGASTFSVQSPNIRIGSGASAMLGFFGSSGSTKTTVSNLGSNPTLSDTASKLNVLINVLRGYGLI